MAERRSDLTSPSLHNRLSPLILFVAVAAAPFPFGSTAPTAIAFWCVWIAVGVMAAPLSGLRRQHIPLLCLALVVVLAYAFVLHEQLAARPWIAAPQALWAQASDALKNQIAPSVSISRNQPLLALGAPLANMLALICGFVVCTDRRRAHRLVLIFAWSGIAYAAYGIAAHFIDPNLVLWREKAAYRDSLTATFINRNTAAVYFGSCAVVWLLLLIQKLREFLPQVAYRWTRLPLYLIIYAPRSIAITFAMLLVCVAAILLTNSRAGIILSLFSLIVASVALLHRALPRRFGLLAVLLGGSLIAILVLQIFGATVSTRFDVQGLSDEGRIETYRSTLRMIADHPWFGTGLGSFVWSFPAYRSADVSILGIWDRAHSTPLELAADLGIPLAGLIVAAWLAILGVLLKGVCTRQRDLIVPVSALAIALLALTHSLVDFSLQIPGFAIPVFALVGAGLAQSFSSKAATAH
jgi:O-antigen ligase